MTEQEAEPTYWVREVYPLDIPEAKLGEWLSANIVGEDTWVKVQKPSDGTVFKGYPEAGVVYQDDVGVESEVEIGSDAPVMKKCAESRDGFGNPVDVYKCPFCQRRVQIDADEDYPDRCPWGCDR